MGKASTCFWLSRPAAWMTRITGPALVPGLVRAFLQAKFSTEERHQRRVGKIRKLEQTHLPFQE